ncbi:hypothetical protein AB0H83_47955 [Dactylosporangium sp. NPDC050688]
MTTAIGINLHGSVPAGRMTTALLHQAIMDNMASLLGNGKAQFV